MQNKFAGTCHDCGTDVPAKSGHAFKPAGTILTWAVRCTACANKPRVKLDDLIRLDGDTWRVIGLGREEDGKVFAHLSSITRFRQQRNGRCPTQIMDWIYIDPSQNTQG